MSAPKLRFKDENGNDYPEWEEKQIDEIANCVAGATPNTKVKEYWENGTISWMSSGEVNNRIITKTEKKISQLGYEKTSTKIVPPNTVVIALAGQGKTRGMVAITRISLCTNQSLASLVSKTDYNSDYLYQYLLTKYDDLRKISSGDGTRGGLNLQLVGQFVIKLPSFLEQEKIASFFSTLDQIISDCQSEVDAWEQQKKGVMQQLFSQKIRFKDDDGNEYPEWEEVTLEECSDCLDNLRIPVKKSDRKQGIYPYYGSTNIQDYVDDYIFDEPLVLLAEDAGPFNDFATKPIAQYAEGKCWVNNHAHVLRAHDNPKYLFYSLEHKDIRMFINNPGRGKLNQEDMLLITIPYPCLAEQQKIASCLSAFDKVIDRSKKELKKYQELKKGLMQQMFV